jgi:hypothetical protein
MSERIKLEMPSPAKNPKLERAPEVKCDLIKLEPIIAIIRAAIWTGILSDEKPVSVMLIAEQESAKTEALKFFRGTSTLQYLSDLTSRGMNPYKDEIQRGKLRHIVLLDLVRILCHGKGVSERTIQTLASLMEEGESETADGGGRTTWDNFPKIGALMGITPSFFKSKRGKWRQTGFLTRFVPVCFKYKDTTVDEIHAKIASGMKLPIAHPESNLPPLPCQIFCEDKFSQQISIRAKTLGQRMDSYGFRYHRILRALAKAQARIRGRGFVNDQDVSQVMRWSEFFTDKEIEL